MAFAGFSPGRGRGAAAGDEPQALGGGDRGLPPSASSTGAMRAPRRRRGDAPSACGTMIVGLLGLRLPQGPRRRLRPARLPVDLAARALRPGVPVRAAQRAADGLLRARRARARGPAARDRGAARPTSTRARSECTVEPRRRRAPRVRIGLGYVRGRARRRGRARSWPRARRGGPFRIARPTSPRARAPGAPRWSSSRGRARATRWRRRRPAAPRCGALGAVAARRRGARRARARGHAARAAARRCRRRRALRGARRAGSDARRLRDDRADAGRAPARRCCAPRAAGRARSTSATSSTLPPRRARAGRRAGGRPPAAGDGQGHRVHAARGRVRDGQPDRPAARSTSATA